MRRNDFRIPLNPRDYDLLITHAAIRNQSVTELTRELLINALHQLLDPDEIERQLEHIRQHLLTGARQLREQAERAGDSETNPPPPGPSDGDFV